MNKKKFQKSLLSLKSWRERAFILALAERALPNARLYFDSIEHQPLSQNDFPYGLPELMDKIWQHLLVLKKDVEKDSTQGEEQIVSLLDQVVACIPDAQQSDHYGVLPAVDCLSLMEQALLAGLNDDKKRAYEASQFSLETVMQFIEFSEGGSLSEEQLIKLFDTHPLIAREFSFQSELNDLLRTASHPGDAFLNELRTLAQDDGVSNIGVSLV